MLATGSTQFPAHQTGARKRKPSPGGGGGEKRKKLGHDSGASGLWACPFYKWDPITYHQCDSLCARRPSDVTQHIERRHQQPVHCPTCGQVFEGGTKNTQKEDHIRQRTCRRVSFSHPGVSPDQMDAIRRKGPVASVPEAKTPQEKQWYGKYQFLFGEAAHLPRSPYYTGVASNASAVADYVQSFIAQGQPQRLATSSPLPRDQQEVLELLLRGFREFERYCGRQGPRTGEAAPEPASLGGPATDGPLQPADPGLHHAPQASLTPASFQPETPLSPPLGSSHPSNPGFHPDFLAFLESLPAGDDGLERDPCPGTISH